MHKIKSGILNNEFGKVICFHGRAASEGPEAYCSQQCAAFELRMAPMNPTTPLEMGISTKATLHCCKREINIKEITQ